MLRILDRHRFYSLSVRGGFTLLELLVATTMSVIIIGVAFFGLVALIQTRSKTEIQTIQEETINLALELIGDDIRTARRINATGVNATTADAAIATSDATTAFNPPLSPASGLYVLYLEIPLQGPSICPAGTDLAGLAPPTIERVLYDIRSSDGTWAGPYVIYRYGRLPTVDGRLSPCTLPQSDQVLLEAIAPDPSFNCPVPGLPSGANGFWSCVSPTANTAKLKLNSTILDASGSPRTYSLESQVSTRGI